MVAIDWAIIAAYLVFVTAVGIVFFRRASGSVAEFFVAGRNLPWWLAGTSLIATSFAADTPLAVTAIVARDGIAGNWVWWNFAFVWILAVVFFARLWRRAGLLTDAELTELRYGGDGGAFLRGFKAVYTSIFISTYTLAWVMLAMQKIVAETMAPPDWVDGLQKWIEASFGLAPGSVDVWKLIVLLSLFVVAAGYTVMSGYWGIVATDLVQFGIAMFASVMFAAYALDSVGGMGALREQLADSLGVQGAADLLSFLPSETSSLPLSTFVIFLAVLWWGDGGGYATQRLFSTRSDRDSVLSVIWYCIVHFALRPWPWVIVALVTIVVYPNLEDREAGYPMLMMDVLPAGLRGLMVASLLAAFMSTVDTHLNWNASYFVNDIYRRFLVKTADERSYVRVSRLATIGYAGLALLMAYFLTSVKDAWMVLFNLQAGIGMVLMLRWFWWRINAWSEFSAMAASLIVTTSLRGVRAAYDLDWSDAYCTLLTVIIVACVWLPVTLLTTPAAPGQLEKFYTRVRPTCGFWGPVAARCGAVVQRGSMAWMLTTWLIACIALYAGMFGAGHIVLGFTARGVIELAACAVFSVAAFSAGRRTG